MMENRSPPGASPALPPSLCQTSKTPATPLPDSSASLPSWGKSAERHCDATASSLPAPDAPAPQDNAQADRQGATPLKKTEPLTCPDVHCNNRVPRGRGRKSSPGTTGATVCRDPRFVSPSLQGLCFHVCKREVAILDPRKSAERQSQSAICALSAGGQWPLFAPRF